MANININRGVQDPFYRYKMPRILAKVEGKGNGIKTVIANMPEIAKALSRPPTYPTKYFGCELGAQTNFDLKNDRYIVNGEHKADRLQEILDKFIKIFVLCPACENPETILTVKQKAQIIQGKCKACGNLYTVDPKQKLSTFILKNPPPTENGEAEKEAKPQENGGTPPGEEANETEAVPNFVVANGQNDQQQDAGSNEEDDDWAEPVEDENNKLSGQMSKMVVDKDLEKSEDERLDMLHQYFQKAVNDGSIQDVKKMLNEAERLELKNKAPVLLINVLFDTKVLAQLKQHKKLLYRFCVQDHKAQRLLLGGIEQLIGAHKDVLLPKTALIIKALYDHEICEEEVLLDWGKKPSKKYNVQDKKLVKAMIEVAQPVLKWLEEAEEASDDDEEEEDNGGVAFDERSRAVGTTVEEEAKEVGKENKAKEAENGTTTGKETAAAADEIDIDNI